MRLRALRHDGRLFLLWKMSEEHRNDDANTNTKLRYCRCAEESRRHGVCGSSPCHCEHNSSRKTSGGLLSLPAPETQETASWRTVRERRALRVGKVRRGQRLRLWRERRRTGPPMREKRRFGYIPTAKLPVRGRKPVHDGRGVCEPCMRGHRRVPRALSGPSYERTRVHDDGPKKERRRRG